MLSEDDMKKVVGGSNQTFCGGCNNWSAGSALDRSNVICVSLPSGTICQDLDGEYGIALHCGTPDGTIINEECFHIS